MKNSTISRIYKWARHPSIPPVARQAIFDDLQSLETLRKLVRRPKRARSVQIQTSKLPVVRKKRVFKPSTTVCKLCKTPFPHQNKLDWRTHMLKVRSHKEWAAAKRYWTRVGYDTLGRASGRARLRTAHNRRLAIFKEEAPRAAAILGDEGILKLTDSYRFGPNRYMYSQDRWRSFVRRHYSRSGER